MRNFLIKYRTQVIFTLIGGIAGIGYWHFVGCSSGTCPITSHWYTMGSYGTAMGFLAGELIKKK